LHPFLRFEIVITNFGYNLLAPFSWPNPRTGLYLVQRSLKSYPVLVKK
jgi:hypothetical protein